MEKIASIDKQHNRLVGRTSKATFGLTLMTATNFIATLAEYGQALR
jgi:hypothetical protein